MYARIFLYYFNRQLHQNRQTTRTVYRQYVRLVESIEKSFVDLPSVWSVWVCCRVGRCGRRSAIWVHCRRCMRYLYKTKVERERFPSAIDSTSRSNPFAFYPTLYKNIGQCALCPKSF